MRTIDLAVENPKDEDHRSVIIAESALARKLATELTATPSLILTRELKYRVLPIK